MDAFTAAVLTSIATDLAKQVVNGLGRATRDRILGTPAEQALERCIETGVVALTTYSTGVASNQEDELRVVLERFFHKPVVGEQIASLLRGRSLDRERLADLFAEADTAGRFPGLRFDDALDAFAAGFLAAADGEKELQGIIQVSLLRQQLQVEEQQLLAMRETAEAVRNRRYSMVRAGTLVLGDQVLGPKIEIPGNYATIHITANYWASGAPGSEQEKKQLDDALKRYLKWVKDKYGRLTLRGLEKREGTQLTLDLDEVYISLEAVVNTEADDQKRRRMRRTGRQDEHLEAEGNTKPVDMATLLALDKRLVITGGPGSGKSTYLHLVASSIAAALLDGDPAEVESHLGLPEPLPLPIVVSLGGFNSFRSKGNLIDYISHAIIQQNAVPGLPADFFERLLRHGRSCLVLLDGLDEVADDSDRAIVRQSVQDLASNEGIDRLIVTSRTRAYQGAAVLPYRLAAVQPMSPDQVDALAGKWCDAAYLADEAVREKDHLRREIRDLEALRASRGQPRLVDTPLLVTIIAIVHDNLRKLPEQRAALYEECVKALLAENYSPATDERRALVEHGGTLNEKRKLLAYLSYEMMAAGESAGKVVEEPQLRRWLRPEIARDYEPKEADKRLEAFCAIMRERGSLLDEQDGRYSFTHLTFQEYLAATYLVDTVAELDDIVSRLTEESRLADSWWRETVLLTSGYFDLRSTERALRFLGRLAALPAPAAGDAELPLSALELAGTAFLELGSGNAGVRKAIADGLAMLLTNPELTAGNPLRGLAGVALGRLGDPRPDVSCDVPAVVSIPAGPFIMGSKKGKGKDQDELAYENEEPRHELVLGEYAVGKYPVTVAQYRRFVDVGKGYEAEKYWTPEGWKRRKDEGWTSPRLWNDPELTVDNHPVVGVSWYEAVAYCAWLRAETGRFFRLPDEAMWEKAARGTDGRRWPWGNEWDPTRLNAEGTIGRTSAVGIFPTGKSPFDVYDATGNVLEWCSGPGVSGTPYPFKQRPYEADLRLRLTPQSRAVRGGAWSFDDQGSRAAFRSDYYPINGYLSVGIRVAEHLSFPES
jgi:formylglycine-generating enzyme required for sulfatase activity